MTTLIPNNYIFNRLTLYNFKMHKSTALNLSEVPIIVISGANGSGKTQILEALILVIGHTPSRVSLSNFKDLVGSFDDYCKINLSLFNPILSDQRVISGSDPTLYDKRVTSDSDPILHDQRVISSNDPDINNFVNNDYFSIEINIDKKGGVKRRIISEDGKQKDITKRQIQTLMKKLGIFEDTMLNFTEEGYLGSFADGSPHKKLDSLLVATGLKEVFSTYLNSKKRVEEKEREHSPLAMQLEKEEQNLQKLKENYERLQKKKELIERFDVVDRELAYFSAYTSKVEFEKVSQDLIDKKKDLETIKENEETTQNSFNVLQAEMKSLDTEARDCRLEIQSMTDKKNRLEGQREEKQRYSEEIRSTIEITEDKKSSFTKLKASDTLTQKMQLQEQLDEVKKQQILSNEKSEQIVSELKQKGEEEKLIKERINERAHLYGEFSDYERRLIKDSISFKEKMQLSKYKDEIIGPLYEVISVTRKYKQFTNVIKSALGRYLFSFVATSQEAYQGAKSNYDELFPVFKPTFTVGRILEKEDGSKHEYIAKQKLEDKPDGILDFVINLIDAPLQVKVYLDRFVRIILASPDMTPNTITDYAKKYRTNILTTDGKSYYLSQEAFTRPPIAYNVNLGVEASKYQSMERIRDQLNKLHKEMEELSLQASQYTKEKTDLEFQRMNLEKQLQPWNLGTDEAEGEFLRLEKTKSELEDQLYKTKISIDNLDSNIEVLEIQIRDMENVFLEQQQNVLEKRKELNQLVTDLQNLATKREKTLKHIEVLAFEYEELKVQSIHLAGLAQEKGAPPEQIRKNNDEIFSEYNQLKGQLDLLEVTTEISPETLESQIALVEKVSKEVEESEVHLNNLKKDLDKRIKEWEGGLFDIVNHLNKMMNLLLGEIFIEISIRIENYNDERNSGLVIEAETKGDKRQYRQLSGGEKTLLAQSLILSLHMINHSPIHAIDEFTQKLDKKNRAIAFSMALTTYRLAKENRMIIPQFILITPMLDDVELSKEFSHKILIESKILGPEAFA